MVIFLLILKIIGIVLLVLACILALILFVPVFYEFEGDIDEGRYTVRISWLLRVVRFRFQFHEKVEAILQILFFRYDFTDPVKKEQRQKRKDKKAAKKRAREEKKYKNKREKRQRSREKEREKARQEIKLEEKLPENSQFEAMESSRAKQESESGPVTAQSSDDVSSPAEESALKNMSASSADQASKSTEGQTSANPEKKDASGQKGSVDVKQIKDIAGGISEKVTGAIGVIRFMREHQILGMIWPKLQVFLIRIRPRQLRGQIQFGFSDPATTGQVLGGIAMIPFLYQTEIVINPDFESEKAYVSGNIYIKGRMHLIHFIILIVKMLLDKNIRSFLSSLRKKK